jgi:hypothetical protein
MINTLLVWLKSLFAQLEQNDKNEDEKIMAALSDVKNELTALQGSLDSLKTAVEARLAASAGAPTAADMDGLVSDLQAKKAEVDALLAEVNPPAPPAPASE